MSHSGHIYLASRLFSNPRSPISSHIAEALSNTLRPEFKVFLPFRDTDQANIVSDSKSRIVYEQDLKALERSSLVIGLVDGVSKDAGVMMELGFAFARGIPYILCSSDFVLPRIIDSGFIFVCDPLVDMYASLVVVEDALALTTSAKSYAQAQFESLDRFATRLVNEVRPLIVDLPPAITLERREGNWTFIDVAGGRYEWCRELMSRLAHQTNVPLTFGSRWENSADRESCRRDLDGLLSCRSAAFIVDGSEGDPGTAFLIGAAAAAHIPIILLYTGPTELVGPGGQVMLRNLRC